MRRENDCIDPRSLSVRNPLGKTHRLKHGTISHIEPLLSVPKNSSFTHEVNRAVAASAVTANGSKGLPLVSAATSTPQLLPQRTSFSRPDDMEAFFSKGGSVRAYNSRHTKDKRQSSKTTTSPMARIEICAGTAYVKVDRAAHRAWKENRAATSFQKDKGGQERDRGEGKLSRTWARSCQGK